MCYNITVKVNNLYNIERGGIFVAKKFIRREKHNL